MTEITDEKITEWARGLVVDAIDDQYTDGVGIYEQLGEEIEDLDADGQVSVVDRVQKAVRLIGIGLAKEWGIEVHEDDVDGPAVPAGGAQ
jgi:hypothetical protein